MEKLLQLIKSFSSQKQSLRETCKRNGIKVSFLVKFSFSKTKKIMRKLESMYHKGMIKVNCNWLQNQLKLFHFSLILLSNLHQLLIKDFDEEQWKQLLEFFPSKDRKIIQYETMSFIADKNDLKKKWTSVEDNMIFQFLEGKDEATINWNDLAVEIFTKSNKSFYRTGKQCKQRWLNHLDLTIKHGQWSEEQDRILIGNVLKIGKKWCIISKLFNGKRTEHMVKNRFLSILVKAKKRKPCVFQEEQLLEEVAEDLKITQKQKQKKIDQASEPFIKEEHVEDKEEVEDLQKLSRKLQQIGQTPKIITSPFAENCEVGLEMKKEAQINEYYPYYNQAFGERLFYFSHFYHGYFQGC